MLVPNQLKRARLKKSKNKNSKYVSCTKNIFILLLNYEVKQVAGLLWLQTKETDFFVLSSSAAMPTFYCQILSEIIFGQEMPTYLFMEREYSRVFFLLLLNGKTEIPLKVFGQSHSAYLSPLRPKAIFSPLNSFSELDQFKQIRRFNLKRDSCSMSVIT